MESYPLVSVIIPNYNHSGYLQERIDSVMNQTFENFEVILLDDCSADSSKEILLSYKETPKVSHVIINTQNSGSTFRQWEKGLNVAKGKYIWIAESDDSASPDFLASLLSVLESNNSVSVAFCKSNIIDEKNEIISLENTQSFVNKTFGNEDYVLDGKKEIELAFRHINIIPNASAVVFRKEAINDTIFDRIKTMKYAGDWLFWISLIENFQIAFISGYLNNFRFHSQSTRGGKSIEDDTSRIKECLDIIDEINGKYNFDKSTLKISWLYEDWIRRVLNRNKDYSEIFKPPFEKNFRYYLLILKIFITHYVKKAIN